MFKMNLKKKKKSKSEEKSPKIFSIDNYSERYFIYDDGFVKPVNKLSYRNNTLATTFIANKDMIIATVDLSAGIPEESIFGALEDKAYDELGLDPAIEYIIQYREVEMEGEGKHYQLFIVEEGKFNEIFGNLREQIKYVDLIAPAPLLYKTLYDHEILEEKKVHCFLYFGTYDTTVVFYSNGEYLYSKSINYSLEQIYDRYCEILGKTVDKREFLRVFQEEGPKTDRMEYQQNLIKLFNEIFITINDIVIYTKRAYKIEEIDQIYIGSEMGPINGVDEYAQNYLGLYSMPMEFEYDIEPATKEYVDQIHYLMILSMMKFMEDSSYMMNFTRYPRPPAFHKRPGGQFVLTTIGAILIATSYPGYYMTYAYLNELHIYKLQKEEKPLGEEVRKYKRILAGLQKKMKELDEKIDGLKKIYDEKEKTLISVYRKKVYYRLKSNQLAAISDELSENMVHTNRIESVDDNFSITVIAKEDRDITGLIKNISEKYHDEIVNIDIKSISKEANSSFYSGVLKVDLK
jgi:hypothetical protein